MNLVNLDDTTRGYMRQELDMDISKDRLYLSKRFTPKGQEDYKSLLREAINYHDAVWLAGQLSRSGRMKGVEISHSRKGTSYIKRTPLSDHETFAYGEFNRFYIRGLCARAIAEGIDHLVVYRALDVQAARSASEERMGSQVDSRDLLDDLRKNVGQATRLGIPGGPNSGISVKLP